MFFNALIGVPTRAFFSLDRIALDFILDVLFGVIILFFCLCVLRTLD